MKNTPTPWKYDTPFDNKAVARVYTEDMDGVIISEMHVNDAEFIVHAVNNIERVEKQRDALLKRLVQIKRFVDEVEENHNAGTSSTCELCHVFNLTKQTIQSVEGEK